MDAFKLQCSNIVKVESVVKAEIVPGLKDTAPQCREILPGGGGTLGISGWGCAAGTLEPLTYTRASSAEFCYPILE